MQVELEKHVLNSGQGLFPLEAPHPSPVPTPMPRLPIMPRLGLWVGQERAPLGPQGQGWKGDPIHQFCDVCLSARDSHTGVQATAVSLNQRRPVRGWPEPVWEMGPVVSQPLAHPTAGSQGLLCLGAFPHSWQNPWRGGICASGLTVTRVPGAVPRIDFHAGLPIVPKTLQAKPPVSCGA